MNTWGRLVLITACALLVVAVVFVSFGAARTIRGKRGKRGRQGPTGISGGGGGGGSCSSTLGPLIVGKDSCSDFQDIQLAIDYAVSQGWNLQTGGVNIYIKPGIYTVDDLTVPSNFNLIGFPSPTQTQPAPVGLSSPNPSVIIDGHVICTLVSTDPQTTALPISFSGLLFRQQDPLVSNCIISAGVNFVVAGSDRCSFEGCYFFSPNDIAAFDIQNCTVAMNNCVLSCGTLNTVTSSSYYNLYATNSTIQMTQTCGVKSGISCTMSFSLCNVFGSFAYSGVGDFKWIMERSTHSTSFGQYLSVDPGVTANLRWSYCIITGDPNSYADYLLVGGDSGCSALVEYCDLQALLTVQAFSTYEGSVQLISNKFRGQSSQGSVIANRTFSQNVPPFFRDAVDNTIQAVASQTSGVAVFTVIEVDILPGYTYLFDCKVVGSLKDNTDTTCGTALIAVDGNGIAVPGTPAPATPALTKDKKATSNGDFALNVSGSLLKVQTFFPGATPTNPYNWFVTLNWKMMKTEA
jgi:hypothetical protein